VEANIKKLENKVADLETRLKDMEFLGTLFLATQDNERLSKLFPHLKVDINRIWGNLKVPDIAYLKRAE